MVHRRTVLRTAAWTAPAVTLITAAPAAAVSGPALSLTDWVAARDTGTTGLRVNFTGTVLNSGSTTLDPVTLTFRVYPRNNDGISAQGISKSGSSSGFTGPDGDNMFPRITNMDAEGWYSEYPTLLSPLPLPPGQSVPVVMGMRMATSTGYLQPDGVHYFGGSGRITASAAAATDVVSPAWPANL